MPRRPLASLLVVCASTAALSQVMAAPAAPMQNLVLNNDMFVDNSDENSWNNSTPPPAESEEPVPDAATEDEFTAPPNATF